MKSSETDHKTTVRAQAPRYTEPAMKRMTPQQVETAKARAAAAAASLRDDPDRADEFDQMSIEEYAAERGIEIVENPKKEENHNMAKTNEQWQQELDEAHERIDELEAERARGAQRSR